MKKLWIALAAVLALLCGCEAGGNASALDYGEEISKAQEISVISSDTVVDTITEAQAIRDFILALNSDQWEFKQLPDEASEIGSFGFAQAETVKLGQAHTDGTLYDIAAITLYEGAYIRFEAGGLDMTFEVTQETSDYLNGYFGSA